MRNVAVIRELQHDLNLETSFGAASCLSVDSEAGVVYTAGEGLVVACHQCRDGEELWRVSLQEASQLAGFVLAPGTTIALFAFVLELEALCLALSSGEILLLTTGAASRAEVEEVGAVEGGVMAGQWSPDGGLLALITGAGQLLLMNKDWDVLAEAPLSHTADGPAQQPPLTPANVALSWRGDARYLATCTPAASASGAPTSTVQIWERESCELHAVGEAAPALYPLLSWQPNGRHLYAAQALHAAQPAQQDAQQAEQGPGLDEQAQQARIGAWKRELRRKEAAAAAAAAAAGEASNRIILYERNGLQHGGFDLPGGGTAVQLEWSRDSELLAIVLRDGDDSGPPSHRLQLWHRSNWHWYLKCERQYTMCGGLAVQWDEVAPRQLHVLSEEGDYQQLEFEWQPLVSQRGTAAVVDGRRVLLTPLRHTIVPPPMCAAAVRCSGAVACAAICDFGESEVLVAVLGNGALEVAVSCEEDMWEESLDEALEAGGTAPAEGVDAFGEPHIRAAPLMLTGEPPPLAGARQAAWAGEGRLVVVVGPDQLVELSIDAAAAKAAEVCSTATAAPLLRCISHPQGGCILQLEGGQIWRYQAGGGLEQSGAGGFPTPCPLVAATPLSALNNMGYATPLAFGLTSKGQLYWGPRQVASEVTSFAVRSEGAGGSFVLYTTRAHFLHTLPLASLLQHSLSLGSAHPTQLGSATPAQQAQQAQQQSFSQAMRAAMRPSAVSSAKDVRVRAVEQNSMLVATPPGGEVVVLQMPRGNLEAIHPRALVLPAVAAAIDCGDWGHAWELAAVNRLDLNVLVDYRWPAFLQQAGEFITQVAKDQDVADLLSSLSPNSTVAEGGLYFGAILYPPQPAAAPTGMANGVPAPAGAPVGEQGNAGVQGAAEGGPGGKVAAVCRAVRVALEAADPVRYLRSVLTSYAKCNELAGALAIVKERKEAELQAGPTPGAPTAEDGLRHLLLFINEDVVYREALGIYDLPLAYMVVAHSQKDPGEYMLELQRFAALPEGPLRAHAIDVHLRRYESALRHLVVAGEAHCGAALELARDKGLLRQLLALYEGQPQLRCRVLEAYAEELERKNMDEDAGLAYMAAGMLERAIEAYLVAGHWRMAMALAGKLGKGQEDIRRLAAELAAELERSARLADAAAVTLEHLQDVGAAVALLGRAREWREALRVAYSYQRADLVEGLVAPQAAGAAAEALRDINDNIERVGKYSVRLMDIRQRRVDMQAAMDAAEDESGLPSRQQDADFDDAASEAVSMVSGLSVYTDRTHTGASSAGSTLAPSTVGGRRPQRRHKKNKSTRIRQGSPEEEQQLAQHILGLAPSPGLCNEVGQLTEALVLLGHEADARVLQQRLAALSAVQQEAVQDVLQHPPPALAMQLSWPAQQALEVQQAKQGQQDGAAAAAGGAGALRAAVAGVLGAMPGAELQLKAAEAEAAQKGARWKWDMLRNP